MRLMHPLLLDLRVGVRPVPWPLDERAADDLSPRFVRSRWEDSSDGSPVTTRFSIEADPR